MINHPLFPVMDINPVRILTSVYNGDVKTLEQYDVNSHITAFSYRDIDEVRGIYQSVIEAENSILKSILEHSKRTTRDFESIHQQPIFECDLYTPIFVCTNAELNQIAIDTRRGKGNHVMMSQSMFDKCLKSVSGAFVKRSSMSDVVPVQVPNSKFILQGTLNAVQHVYVHPDWDEDHPIIVGYHSFGSDYADSSVVLNGKGPYELYISPYSPPWYYFYRILTIKNL